MILWNWQRKIFLILEHQSLVEIIFWLIFFGEDFSKISVYENYSNPVIWDFYACVFTDSPHSVEAIILIYNPESGEQTN